MGSGVGVDGGGDDGISIPVQFVQTYSTVPVREVKGLLAVDPRSAQGYELRHDENGNASECHPNLDGLGSGRVGFSTRLPGRCVVL